jgi:hypothetical protein
MKILCGASDKPNDVIKGSKTEYLISALIEKVACFFQKCNSHTKLKFLTTKEHVVAVNYTGIWRYKLAAALDSSQGSCVIV